jgi:hypothetical protein
MLVCIVINPDLGLAAQNTPEPPVDPRAGGWAAGRRLTFWKVGAPWAPCKRSRALAGDLPTEGGSG